MHALMLRVLVFIAYQPYDRALNIYWNYIFVFKFKQSSYLFSLKNYRPCRDLNPGCPRHQADMLPIELSWLGSIGESLRERFYAVRQYNNQQRPIDATNL